jgi:hypothetical protein
MKFGDQLHRPGAVISDAAHVFPRAIIYPLDRTWIEVGTWIEWVATDPILPSESSRDYGLARGVGTGEICADEPKRVHQVDV